MLLKIVNLIFAGQCHVACWGDNLNFGGEYLECQVETHLVVAGAGRAVSHCVGPYFLGVFNNGDCLEYTFRRHTDGVGAVAEHITGYHVFDAFVVVVTGHVEGSMRGCPEFDGFLFDGGKLFCRKASGIGYGCVYFIT